MKSLFLSNNNYLLLNIILSLGNKPQRESENHGAGEQVGGGEFLLWNGEQRPSSAGFEGGARAQTRRSF